MSCQTGERQSKKRVYSNIADIDCFSTLFLSRHRKRCFSGRQTVSLRSRIEWRAMKLKACCGQCCSLPVAFDSSGGISATITRIAGQRRWPPSRWRRDKCCSTRLSLATNRRNSTAESECGHQSDYSSLVAKCLVIGTKYVTRGTSPCQRPKSSSPKRRCYVELPNPDFVTVQGRA